jgi:hypothetical protein
MGRNQEKLGLNSGFQQTLAVLAPGRRFSPVCWRHLSGRSGYLVKVTRPWAALLAASPRGVQTQPEVFPGYHRDLPGFRPVN